MGMHPCTKCDYWENECHYEKITFCKLPCRKGKRCDFNPMRPAINNPMQGTSKSKMTKSPKKQKKMVWLDTEKAMALYKQGLRDKEIAIACNVCNGTAQQWRKKLGLPPNNRERDALYKKIKALYELGMSDTAISEELEISRNAIAYWRRKNCLPNNWIEQKKTNQKMEEKKIC